MGNYEGRKNPIIDEIVYNGKKHFVYYKTPVYWLISIVETKKHMFSVLVCELDLNDFQKKHQRELEKNRLKDVAESKGSPKEINFKYDKNGKLI